MLTNYLKITIRNLRKNVIFAITSITGLTFGLAVFFILALYLVNELTYDRYHADSELIYRIYQEVNIGNSATAMGPHVNAPLGPYLLENYPEVVSQTRISKGSKVKFNFGENDFVDEIFYADNSIFRVFTFEFILGNRQTALQNPFDIVLTEKSAKKYFGNSDPVGRTIKCNDGRDYTVTAVIENIPDNSNLKFNLIGSFSSLNYLDVSKGTVEGWGMEYQQFFTYIKTSKVADIKKLDAELPKIVETYLSQNSFFKYTLSFQPLEQIYLYCDGDGSISRIILFGAIGLLVLLIPCINYMNLNFAHAIKRLKEIGVRKVVGASKQKLGIQFLFESVFVCLISFILAIILAELLLPIFNSILGKNLTFNISNRWLFTAGLLVISILAGIIVGSYPAFYLSSFSTFDALKGKFLVSSGRSYLRNGFIVLQFAISIFLICCTGVILMQIYFSNNSDLGFNKDNILSVQLPYQGDVNSSLIVDHLSRMPEINKISMASGAPFIFKAFGHFNFNDQNSKKLSLLFVVDSNYVDLLDLKIVKGNNFSKCPFSAENRVLVNETLTKQLGWEDPVGKIFKDYEDQTEYTVVGVVKDFHTDSFYKRIYPCFICLSNDSKIFNTILCEVSNVNRTELLQNVNSICESLVPDMDVEITFLEQAIAKEYSDAVRTGKMFMYLAIIAIFITLIGAYVLALLNSRQRVKEIGIRKVFGSSVRQIIALLISQFIRLAAISIVIAIPAAWYYTRFWLQSFVFQLNNKWVVFVFASLSVILLSILTVIYQSYKTANSNPVDTLRVE